MKYTFEVRVRKTWGKPMPEARNHPEVSRLTRMLVLAHQIEDYMRTNNIHSLKEFCAHAHITPARATQITSLLMLSPKIQSQILSEKLELPERVLRQVARTLSWPDQGTLLEENTLLLPAVNL